MSEKKLDMILPTFFRLCKFLAVIPATSCSMAQRRLNCLAVLNIERAFTNRVMRNADKIVDIFGQRKNRKSYFL
jgi:hypothetical protein